MSRGGLLIASSACLRASSGWYSGLATVCVVISAGTRSEANTPCTPRLSIIFCSIDTDSAGYTLSLEVRNTHTLDFQFHMIVQTAHNLQSPQLHFRDRGFEFLPLGHLQAHLLARQRTQANMRNTLRLSEEILCRPGNQSRWDGGHSSTSSSFKFSSHGGFLHLSSRYWLARGLVERGKYIYLPSASSFNGGFAADKDVVVKMKECGIQTGNFSRDTPLSCTTVIPSSSATDGSMGQIPSPKVLGTQRLLHPTAHEI